jgi:flagellum-specific peptidoglycan hydrolase FlgJ
LFTADQKKTGILASVSMAQFILESATANPNWRKRK